MSETPFTATEIARRHADWTHRWHEAPTPAATEPPWSSIEINHRMNFDLWHEEDIARRDDLGAERVRQAKRLIDRCNQARNDAMEKIDLWLLGQLPPANTASQQHSETPGMMIDRLSILALKFYHTRIEAERAEATAEHRAKCADRGVILESQTSDLARCVDELLAAFRAGTQHFKLYRQFKMYNDPSFNPQMYSGRKTAAA